MPEQLEEPEFNPNAYNTLFARFEEKLDNIANNISELKVNHAKNEEDIKEVNDNLFNPDNYLD